MASLLQMLSIHYLIDGYIFYKANSKDVTVVISHIKKVSSHYKTP